MSHHGEFSLRLRLLRLLLLPLVIGLCTIGGISYLGAHHEAEEVYDAQLAHFASMLALLMQHEVDEGDTLPKHLSLPSQQSGNRYEKHYAYRAWLNHHVFLSSTGSEKFGPLSTIQGYSNRTIGEVHWRFFTLKQGALTVEVAEEYEVRLDLIRHVLAGIFLPQLLVLPLVGLIIWAGVMWGLSPLTKLSSLIRDRHAGSLHPINVPAVPQEVAPVIDAINDLMQRMAEGLEKEKHFSNYAAHELRTPLAALKTQVQVALRSHDRTQQQELFAETLHGIDRMSHLVDQLLTFVRVQKQEPATESRIYLAALLRDVMAHVATIARQRTISLQVNLDDQVRVTGHPEMLRVMMNNLVDNAIKYTPDGSMVAVTLVATRQEAILSITDQGPGIQPRDRPYIFDRFYRAADVMADGSGLGLAIVKWVADQHQLVIQVAENPQGRGTQFSIHFPLAA